MLLIAASATTTGIAVLGDVVLVLAVAVALGTVLQRAGYSPIIGYLLTGVLLGPGALGLIRNVDTFSIMGELGIALLLFTIGLELPWHRLHRIGGMGVRAGVLQLAITIAVYTPLIVLVGVDWRAALALAMAISLSSTAVVLRLLADRTELESVHGLAALGVLIAQDIATVLFLLIIADLGGSPNLLAMAGAFALSLGKLAVLVGGMYALERLVVRRLFRHLPGGSQRELLALVSITISLGAVGVSDYMGLPIAIGGFAAGMIIGEAPYADQVRGEIAPLRMGLLVLFFAWMGMLADVSHIADNLLPILGIVAAVLIGKTVLITGSLIAVGSARRAAMMAGLSMAQVGEFSFAIAAAAQRRDVLDDDLFQLFVSSALITLLLTPLLMSLSRRVFFAARFDGIVGADAERAAGEAHTGEDASGVARHDHAVVVGYGPAGRQVVNALVKAGVPVAIVELNTRLRGEPQDRVRVVYGDATLPEVLDRAAIKQARTVIVTLPEPATVRRIVSNVSAYAPDVPLVARGRYHLYLDQIREAGADAVIDEESGTGDELARAALRSIGIL